MPVHIRQVGISIVDYVMFEWNEGFPIRWATMEMEVSSADTVSIKVCGGGGDKGGSYQKDYVSL